jgi:hypothetical protein
MNTPTQTQPNGEALTHLKDLFRGFDPQQRMATHADLREIQMRLLDIARLLDEHAPSVARELALATSREIRVKFNL